ncbi:winged helix DNA-binding domain-containing protein [Actinomadura rayongensis]|uniref:Winged helix DNA-binding domain-containing protein n=1 Tax=Actinomadura rayongensis TaxID=1429076 RepID=A0A6I4WBH7_9ACTN|nr:winged helix DNA-binding domain-containing protein [Actinomadura rayongensis]MXQ64092.1 winged helix DNA-binding domain-containing protein [Actinomadura rayongensis]
MRTISTDERRARLALRHRLAPGRRTDDPAETARSLVALHATDPATVYLSAAARSRNLVPSALEAALYDDRTLLRLLAMRRTMFVVPVELAPVLQASCADALAAKQLAKYSGYMEKSGVPDARAFFAATAEEAHATLLKLGRATGAQLSKEVPALRTTVQLAPGKSYSTPTSITTWVLVTLGLQGRIVRGRPNGSWISSQYVWQPIEEWIPGGVPVMPAKEARAALVREWLRAFGPAPVSDIKWWTGWTVAEVKSALAEIATVEVDLDGVPGLVLADDVDPVAAPEPWAALLPALDPTPMGWKERDWFLGPHAPALFDRNGNIGPTVWWDGRIVGGWAQRADGEIAVRFLEDAGADARAAVAAEAERTAAFYGTIRAVPRFRTPLERELSA